MSDATQTQPDDVEEPPLVHGLLARGAEGAGRAVHAVLHRAFSAVDRRVLLVIAGAATLAMFAGILAMSLAKEPNLSGLLSGIFGGAFTALLFAAAMTWLAIWALAPGRAPRRFQPDAPGELDGLLAPTLRELRVVRADVVRKVRARSVTRIPLAVAGAIVLWVLMQWDDDPPGTWQLLLFCVMGAVAGEAWAAHKLAEQYRRLYKERVLPRLAARFGDLTYRPAPAPDLAKLRAHRIFKEFDQVVAEDEIAGTHRGLPLSIVEARLSRGSGDDRVVVFGGLLVDLTLPRSLTGTTVIVTDEGVVGNLAARFRMTTLEPVRLEDPRFHERYQVYATDQIEARALLTPSFMERFMALAQRSRFSLPGALGEGNRLIIALPKLTQGDLFEPPSYWQPVGGTRLRALSGDIDAVLRMADTVIDLDFWARGAGTAGGRLPE